MKLSMMSYTLARLPEFEVRKMFALAAELQLEGLDMVTLYEQKPADIRKMSEDHGVPLVAYTFFARGLACSDKPSRQQGIDDCKRGLEIAVELGVPVVMLPPSPPKDSQDRAATRRNYIEGLKAVMPFARQAGVTFTVENFPGLYSPFVTAADFLAAQAEIPDLGLTFDNGNAASGGEEVGESFKRVAKFVAHAHFKDWYISSQQQEGYRQMLDGKWYKPALIGEGDIDQRSTIRAMHEAGYDKYINLEYEGNSYSGKEAMQKAVNYLREIFAEL